MEVIIIVILCILFAYYMYSTWKPNKDPGSLQVVNVKESDRAGQKVTYSEWYTIDICPKCKHLLDDYKARYDSKCCYKCGYRNGSIFTTSRVSVRDVYVEGKVVETVLHHSHSKLN